MVTANSIALFLHISSVIIWLFTIPVLMVVKRALTFVESKENKFNVMKIALINSRFGLIAMIGIFLTGSMLTRDLWFNFEVAAWLAVKQIIFFLIVIFGSMWMMSKDKQFQKAIADNESIENVTSLFKSLTMQSHVIAGFVLINVFLATVKPF